MRYGQRDRGHLGTYSSVRGVLVRRENVPVDTAEEIARRLDGLSQHVGDAVWVARLRSPQTSVAPAGFHVASVVPLASNQL